MDLSIRNITFEELDYIFKNLNKISNNIKLDFIDLIELMNDNPNLSLSNILKEDNNE